MERLVEELAIRPRRVAVDEERDSIGILFGWRIQDLGDVGQHGETVRRRALARVS